ADKGIFHLLKELAYRPGIVAKEYIAGKRRKYFNPFTFFLILAACYVLSISFFSKPTSTNDHKLPAQIENIKDANQKATATVQYERGKQVSLFVKKNGNVLAMFAVPFFAFYFWLIFRKGQYNYSEHLVANVMFISFANLAFSLVVFPLEAMLRDSSWEAALPLLGFLIQLVYITVAYKQLMAKKGFWATTKIGVLTLFGIMLWVISTSLAMAFYIFQNSHFLNYFRYMTG
ncbi:MAG TPA: DUF3667 domain-containing protein, partial [Flavobacterium sp.]|nr:DUF3667 domain-containing protein [Flavobacterium sp.]